MTLRKKSIPPASGQLPSRKRCLLQGKLLIFLLLAPLFIGAAPPEANQNTIEFWGGTGQYRRDSGCGHYQKVKKYDAVVSFKHQEVVTEEYLNDSGKVAVKKMATPFTLIIDASISRGTATDIDEPYDGYPLNAAEEPVENYQLGFKAQGDWRTIGFGMGGLAFDDRHKYSMAPAFYLRIGPRDQFFLTGEFLYANPVRSGHGAFAVGLGHQADNLDLWIGQGANPDDETLRYCLTVKYHFDRMLLGVDASYGTTSRDGVMPYSFSVGVGYEF